MIFVGVVIMVGANVLAGYLDHNTTCSHLWLGLLGWLVGSLIIFLSLNF